MRQINYLSLEQKIELKQMMDQEKCIIPTVTLDFRPQC